jgi:RDD family.
MVIKRLLAFGLDLMIIVAIVNVLFLSTFIIKSQFLLQFLSALMITLLFCKDCMNGQSIGKRVMKLQVVDSNTEENISAVRHIVRNLFLPLWCIEILILMISKRERIGDYVAKTKVISNDAPVGKMQLDKNTLFAILLCFIVIFFLSFIMFHLIDSSMVQLLF